MATLKYPSWYRISQRHPKPNERCLIFNKHNMTAYTATYRGTVSNVDNNPDTVCHVFQIDDGHGYKTPEFWMPLPPNPEF